MQAYESDDSVRIRRLYLRDAQGRSGTVQAGLTTADWPSTVAGETLILRRLRVSGSALGIGTLAAAQARGLAARAVDGEDPRADGAEAVRFRSRDHLLGCLVADLLAGRAAKRWYWRTFADLFALPPGLAAARALAREPLLLPAVAARLRKTAHWRDFWQALSPEDARELLAAVWRETGWPALATSAAAVARPPASSADASPAPRSAAELPPLPNGLAPEDPRLRLAAVVVLWRRAPQVLARAAGSAALAEVARGLTGRAASAASAAAAKQPTAPVAEGAQSPLPTCRQPAGTSEIVQHYRDDEPDLPTPSGTSGSPPAPVVSDVGTMEPFQWPISPAVPPKGHEPLFRHRHWQATPTREARAKRPEGPADRDQAIAGPHHPDVPMGAPSRRDRERHRGDVPSPISTAISTERERARVEEAAPATPEEHRLVTAKGGLFYLLNLLALPAAQEALADHSLPGLAAGWVWLDQVGRALGCEPDEPLARFLAAEAGLEGPAALVDLSPAPALPTLLRLGSARYGEAVFNGALCDLPALVTATRSHLDLHFRMEDVRLPVRRVALDVNPGWLPWLGRVVTFHYGRIPELAGWDHP